MLGQVHSSEEIKYLKEQYQKAKILLRNIGKREETLAAVAEAIVDWQREFFEKGKASDFRRLVLKSILRYQNQFFLHKHIHKVF